jgi:hypothetical protein
MHDGNLKHVKCKTSKDLQEIESLKERRHEGGMKKEKEKMKYLLALLLSSHCFQM